MILVASILQGLPASPTSPLLQGTPFTDKVPGLRQTKLSKVSWPANDRVGFKAMFVRLLNL